MLFLSPGIAFLLYFARKRLYLSLKTEFKYYFLYIFLTTPREVVTFFLETPHNHMHASIRTCVLVWSNYILLHPCKLEGSGCIMLTFEFSTFDTNLTHNRCQKWYSMKRKKMVWIFKKWMNEWMSEELFPNDSVIHLDFCGPFLGFFAACFPMDSSVNHPESTKVILSSSPDSWLYFPYHLQDPTSKKNFISFYFDLLLL